MALNILRTEAVHTELLLAQMSNLLFITSTKNEMKEKKSAIERKVGGYNKNSTPYILVSILVHILMNFFSAALIFCWKNPPSDNVSFLVLTLVQHTHVCT